MITKISGGDALRGHTRTHPCLLYTSLNGLWKFHYAKNYRCTIKGFEKEEYNCSSWDDIRVPAHIQMEGYDVPQYANVQYPWEGKEKISPGEIPEEFNPVASYVKYFEVPDNMKGKPVFISFQGAESGLALWLNGVFIGYSEDSFTPSEFELTSYLNQGVNKLAVQVFKWTSSSWCEYRQRACGRGICQPAKRRAEYFDSPLCSGFD